MRQLKIGKGITNRDESLSLEKYLQDIGKEELISPEDEVILAQKIKQGDALALEKLCKANLRFVVSVAKQYQNQGLSLPDLINEGNLGLIKAAEKFDETRGFKFISYAVWWIRQAILQAIAEESRLVRLPLSQIGCINRIKKARGRLEQELERDPSAEELAEFLQLSPEKIRMTAGLSTTHISLDAEIGNDPNDFDSLLDRISNDEPPTDDLLIKKLDKEGLRKLLMILSVKERMVIKMHYEDDMNLSEIAEHLNRSREAIRLIKEKAIRKLRWQIGIKIYLST
jgi:RNA polymerase primary sigma factor